MAILSAKPKREVVAIGTPLQENLATPCPWQKVTGKEILP